VTRHPGSFDPAARQAITGGNGVTVWLTGLSGSGKSTIAREVEARLIGSGRAAYVLDGDNLRHGINADLGFSREDRVENVRRVGEIARLMADAGLVVLVPVIAPYDAGRKRVRAEHEKAGLDYIEVFVDTPIEVCEDRDPKGLYARARDGEISGMTGIDDPYEAPTDAELTIDTSKMSVYEAAERVLSQLTA
jgi:bifunctional enzyme CysN/CysC